MPQRGEMLRSTCCRGWPASCARWSPWVRAAARAEGLTWRKVFPGLRTIEAEVLDALAEGSGSVIVVKEYRVKRFEDHMGDQRDETAAEGAEAEKNHHTVHGRGA